MDEFQRFRLDGRVAIVAGGSGGIGLRACEALAAVGAKVTIIGQSEERLAAAQRAVEAVGSEALALKADMHSKADADRSVDEEQIGFFEMTLDVEEVKQAMRRARGEA